MTHEQFLKERRDSKCASIAAETERWEKAHEFCAHYLVSMATLNLKPLSLGEIASKLRQLREMSEGVDAHAADTPKNKALWESLQEKDIVSR